MMGPLILPVAQLALDFKQIVHNAHSSVCVSLLNELKLTQPKAAVELGILFIKERSRSLSTSDWKLLFDIAAVSDDIELLAILMDHLRNPTSYNLGEKFMAFEHIGWEKLTPCFLKVFNKWSPLECQSVFLQIWNRSIPFRSDE